MINSVQKSETIFEYEEAPHRLVTKERVEEKWSPLFKQFFTDFCWPLTDSLYVMWDLEPSDWKPINHSCDPNSWMDGLNLTARRDISDGEEITMDYATMYTTDGPNFNCLCGSPLCRGRWKPDDFMQDWFEERYGHHVTEHVKQKRSWLKMLKEETEKVRNEMRARISLTIGDGESNDKGKTSSFESGTVNDHSDRSKSCDINHYQ